MHGDARILVRDRPRFVVRPPRPLSRRTWFQLAAGSLVATGGLPGAAEEALPRPDQLLTPDTSKAIERGLEYLAQRQNADGSLGRGGYSFNVAVVALAGMAYMSCGYTPDRGKYGKQVERCVEYLLQNSEQSGFINAPAFSGPGPMYGHGFATLFLAEAYGMTPEPRVRDRLARAVKLIVNTQNDEGGWRYFPQRQDADLSVTVCQVMALRAARNAGIYVPSEVIDRCLEYVRRCQNGDGGFMYQLTQPPVSEFPRSAAGVVALYSAGVYRGESIDKGLRYLIANAPRQQAGAVGSYFFYGQYYAAQAMYQAGGNYWTEWYPAMRDILLRLQRPGGEWEDPICAEYGTAMACIVLQMPNSYLPIFQR